MNKIKSKKISVLKFLAFILVHNLKTSRNARFAEGFISGEKPQLLEKFRGM